MPLYDRDEKHPHLHEEVVALFKDVQLEYVQCERCGEFHPPELHLSPVTPFESDEPVEA
jgi:hypothetical protein